MEIKPPCSVSSAKSKAAAEMNHQENQEDFMLRHLKILDNRCRRMQKVTFSHLSAMSQGIHYEISKTLCKMHASTEAGAEYFILYLPKSVSKLILIVCTKIRMLCFNLILSGFNTKTVVVKFFCKACCSELKNPLFSHLPLN